MKSVMKSVLRNKTHICQEENIIKRHENHEHMELLIKAGSTIDNIRYRNLHTCASYANCVEKIPLYLLKSCKTFVAG